MFHVHLLFFKLVLKLLERTGHRKKAAGVGLLTPQGLSKTQGHSNQPACTRAEDCPLGRDHLGATGRSFFVTAGIAEQLTLQYTQVRERLRERLWLLYQLDHTEVLFL